MKKLFKLGSLLTMVMLLALGTMVTSCGDDDDEGGGGGKTINKVVFDGKELTVTKAEYNLNDLKVNNNYSLCLNFSNGTRLIIMLSGDKHDNQLIDMTKPETDLNKWFWVFDYMDAESQSIIYGDGDTDPHPFDAGSTMKVRCLNKETGEFEVEFKVIKSGHTIQGFYKGTFTPMVK